MVKEALNLSGFHVGGVRLPLVDATPEQSDHLAQVMRGSWCFEVSFGICHTFPKARFRPRFF